MPDLMATLDILASSLTAQKTRVELSSANMANAQTTRGIDGGPYKRRDPIFTAIPVDNFDNALHQVEVSAVEVDDTPPKHLYQPNHPDADKEGYVLMPNVTVLEEMVNLMEANRSYEAGVSSLHAVTQMLEKTLELGK